MNKVFFAITGTNHHYGHEFFKSNMTVKLIKEPDAIIHKARIEADRKGTKAAAVTAMFAVAGCAPSFDLKNVELTRPFIYAIMHNETGLPVFTGIVNKL